MEHVNLGKSGLKVTRLCLGCMSFGSSADWMIDEESSRAMVRRALDAGIDFFDTANVYSRGESEEILGRSLREFGVQRDQVVIATKVCGAMGDSPNQRGLSRKHIMHSVDDSLRRLNTDYIDLYQIHRHDASVPMEETLEALADVVRAGKVRYIGASSMWAWQFAKYLYLADRHGYPRFVSMQNHYSLLYREEEREMIPLCQAEGVGLIPWGPLAGGVLAGSRKAGTVRSQNAMSRSRYQRPEDQKVVDAVAAVAERHNVKPATIGIAWILQRPGITAPILGATKLSQLDDTIGALDIQLSDEDVAALEAPYLTQPVVGHA